MSKLVEKIKEIKENNKELLNLNKKQAKMATWGAYIVIALILFSMLSNNLFATKPTNESNVAAPIELQKTTVKSEADINVAEQELERRLEQILSQMKGAGKVNVNVTLESGPTYEYAVNAVANTKKTEEQVNGGSRVISESVEDGKLVITRSNNNEMPVVVKESKPAVLGVLVVAEGAHNPQVKLELSRAVETVLGIASHQVHVVPRER